MSTFVCERFEVHGEEPLTIEWEKGGSYALRHGPRILRYYGTLAAARNALTRRMRVLRAGHDEAEEDAITRLNRDLDSRYGVQVYQDNAGRWMYALDDQEVWGHFSSEAEARRAGYQRAQERS